MTLSERDQIFCYNKICIELQILCKVTFTAITCIHLVRGFLNKMSNDITNTVLLGAQIIRHTEIFMEHISSLYLNDAYSDVVLIVDGNRFPSHRNVLRARSEYFQ